MELSDLSPEEQKNVRDIMEWVNRMTQKHGVCLYDELGTKYNWGTALCKELYGDNWQEYMKKNGIACPNADAVAMAEVWESGELPSWIKLPEDENEKDKSLMVVLEEDLGKKNVGEFRCKI